MFAAEYGHHEFMRLLLDSDKVEINHQTLAVAAQNGRETILPLLLEKEPALLNERDSKGRTALISATQYGHAGFVELLLAYPRIEINLKDGKGQTALHWAYLRGRVGVTKILLARDEVELPEEFATKNYLLEAVSENTKKEGHSEGILRQK